MRYCIALLGLVLSMTAFSQLVNSQALPDQVQGEVKVTQIAKATKQWDGSPLPPYPIQNPEITILAYEIPLGMRLPVHKHPVMNTGVVLQGRLTVVTKEGKQLMLNPSDSIVELVHQWHYGFRQGASETSF